MNKPLRIERLRVKQLAAEHFNTAACLLACDTDLRVLDGYDSLSVLLFMLALEEQLKLKFPAEKIRSWRFYRDIETTLQDAGVTLIDSETV